MEEVNITELESRFFSDLFACCDIEKTGKVPILKATEMFRSSNIPDDILKNVGCIKMSQTWHKISIQTIWTNFD